MLTAEIQQALDKGRESQRIEFKTSTGERNEIVETLVAMANTQGGSVLVGVRDNGRVVGVTIGQDTREDLVNYLYQNTDPVLYPSVEVVEIEGREVLLLTVAESDNKPHLAFGRGYRRVGPSTRRMGRDEYERLLFQRQGIAFDTRLVPEATEQDLDEEKVT
jgi:ATP-dependent DNA helicase RecG